MKRLQGVVMSESILASSLANIYQLSDCTGATVQWWGAHPRVDTVVDERLGLF